MHARVVGGPSLDQERAVSETQMVVILASTELHKLYAKSKTPANVLYESRIQQFKLKAMDSVVSHCGCHQETIHQRLSQCKPKRGVWHKRQHTVWPTSYHRPIRYELQSGTCCRCTN